MEPYALERGEEASAYVRTITTRQATYSNLDTISASGPIINSNIDSTFQSNYK